MTNTKTFKTGQTYTFRFIGDADLLGKIEVVKRTAKFITIKMKGERDLKRVGVSISEGAEMCRPYGAYSMAPICSAS